VHRGDAICWFNVKTCRSALALPYLLYLVLLHFLYGTHPIGELALPTVVSTSLSTFALASPTENNRLRGSRDPRTAHHASAYCCAAVELWVDNVHLT